MDGNEPDRYERQDFHIQTCNEIIDISTELDDFFDEFVFDYIMQRIDDLMVQGSGFSL